MPGCALATRPPAVAWPATHNRQQQACWRPPTLIHHSPGKGHHVASHTRATALSCRHLPIPAWPLSHSPSRLPCLPACVPNMGRQAEDDEDEAPAQPAPFNPFGGSRKIESPATLAERQVCRGVGCGQGRRVAVADARFAAPGPAAARMLVAVIVAAAHAAPALPSPPPNARARTHACAHLRTSPPLSSPSTASSSGHASVLCPSSAASAALTRPPLTRPPTPGHVVSNAAVSNTTCHRQVRRQIQEEVKRGGSVRVAAAPPPPAKVGSSKIGLSLPSFGASSKVVAAPPATTSGKAAMPAKAAQQSVRGGRKAPEPESDDPR